MKTTKVFALDHNSVMKDILKEVETTPSINECDVVLLWNDVSPLERGIINLARSMGKKTIVLQHGRKGTSKYFAPFEERIQADKLLVWGEFDRSSLIEAGQEEKRITVVGSTIFSHLRERKEHKDINIVFSPEHWDGPLKENTRVRDELRRLRGLHVITKLIDSPSHNPDEYDNVVMTNRADDDHIDKTIELLQKADLVVGISESTFELLAQAMDIPVVIVDAWEPKTFGGDSRYFTYRRVISDAAKKTTVKNLRKTIGQQLANPEELRHNRAKVAIDEGGINLDSLELIRKEIYE